MRSPRTKPTFALLAGLLLVIGLVDIVYEYVEQRSMLRIHAAMTTAGVSAHARQAFRDVKRARP